MMESGSTFSQKCSSHTRIFLKIILLLNIRLTLGTITRIRLKEKKVTNGHKKQENEHANNFILHLMLFAFLIRKEAVI
jgi:hypothetical protein